MISRFPTPESSTHEPCAFEDLFGALGGGYISRLGIWWVSGGLAIGERCRGRDGDAHGSRADAARETGEDFDDLHLEPKQVEGTSHSTRLPLHQGTPVGKK